MKTLIITAHPSSKGFTHQIAEAYKKGCEVKARASVENGPKFTASIDGGSPTDTTEQSTSTTSESSVEILDLYKTDIKQDFLRYEERSDMAKPDSAREAMQAKIASADDIVFVHPMWWVSPPAILKNFIDVNFAAHFAFRYINGKPVGLLKGKTTSVVILAYSYAVSYYLDIRHLAVLWS
jgi:putative NADPH-quinone reductase